LENNMRIKQLKNVTEAYKDRIYEQEFEDKPIDLSDNRDAVTFYERKINGLTLEAKLIEKEIAKLDRRGLIKIINSTTVEHDQDSLAFESQYDVFTDDPHFPDHIVVMNYPMNKHPEIKQRVLKLCKKLNEIFEIQTDVLSKLKEFDLHPFRINEGEWKFHETI